MAPKRRLSYEERVKIQVLRDEGYSLAAIADKVKCSHSSVPKNSFKRSEWYLIEREVVDHKF